MVRPPLPRFLPPESSEYPLEPSTGWERQWGKPQCPNRLVPLGVGTALPTPPPAPSSWGPLPVLTHRGPTAVTQQRLFLTSP